MLDRTIPFYNTIMKCSDYSLRHAELPDGFSIVSYQRGAAEQYFAETYLQNPKLFSNILFLLNKKREIVGSCIAWQDKRGENSVSSLHWLIVQEQYQRMGLGRALGTAVMNIYAEHGKLPVYIHTQPWSWKAILLYVSLGFRLQKTDTFSHYENEYGKSMDELEKIVSKEQYELLLRSSEG